MELLHEVRFQLPDLSSSTPIIIKHENEIHNEENNKPIEQSFMSRNNLKLARETSIPNNTPISTSVKIKSGSRLKRKSMILPSSPSNSNLPISSPSTSNLQTSSPLKTNLRIPTY